MSYGPWVYPLYLQGRSQLGGRKFFYDHPYSRKSCYDYLMVVSSSTITIQS